MKYCIIPIIALSMVSCSLFDSDDDSQIYELPESNDYSFTVDASPWNQALFVYHNAGVTIDSLVVTVNGTELDMYVSYNAHGGYPFVEGETYTIDVTVNGTYHQAVDLTIATTPVVDFPTYFEEGVDALVSWSLNKNAKTQYIYFSNAREDPYSPYNNPIYLYSAQRRYTMDAELFNQHTNSHIGIVLREYNWITQGEFLFRSGTVVYNDEWRAEDIEPHMVNENH